ncbi:hypothetical protein [Halomonas sp. LBP4]|uniref:hypothetical protein n=1 Tax=Halomonas sp. LBP4 TaxID=2044917 RepID=UPI000D7739A5|nr:hypothetical protein [Halomonas sp. LBP4]PXX95901.1 hypothetical protein CR157_17015 [Halomonas sp. LBP4]
MKMEASFDVLLETDMFVMIADRDDGGRSVANDAENVVQRVSNLLGGIGKRRLYYRDSLGRFNELKVANEQFSGFATCTEHQQRTLADWIHHYQPSKVVSY